MTKLKVQCTISASVIVIVQYVECDRPYSIELGITQNLSLAAASPSDIRGQAGMQGGLFSAKLLYPLMQHTCKTKYGVLCPVLGSTVQETLT